MCLWFIWILSFVGNSTLKSVILMAFTILRPVIALRIQQNDSNDIFHVISAPIGYMYADCNFELCGACDALWWLFMFIFDIFAIFTLAFTLNKMDLLQYHIMPSLKPIILHKSTKCEWNFVWKCDKKLISEPELDNNNKRMIHNHVFSEATNSPNLSQQRGIVSHSIRF